MNQDYDITMLFVALSISNYLMLDIIGFGLGFADGVTGWWLILLENMSAMSLSHLGSLYERLLGSLWLNSIDHGWRSLFKVTGSQFLSLHIWLIWLKYSVLPFPIDVTPGY